MKAMTRYLFDRSLLSILLLMLPELPAPSSLLYPQQLEASGELPNSRRAPAPRGDALHDDIAIMYQQSNGS